MNLKTPLLLALLLAKFCIYAQQEPEAEYLSKSAILDISVINGNLDIRESFTSEKKFYRNFEKHSREAVYFSDFDPIISFEASTMVPEKSGYRKMKVSTIETRDIVQPGIFYGGYKRNEFVYPKLSGGAIGKLEYTKKITDAHLLAPFYFGDHIQVGESEFSVTFPMHVKVMYKVFGAMADQVAFTESQPDGRTKKYTWVLKNIPPFRPEKDSPSRPYVAPHVVAYVHSYEHRGKTVNVLSNVADLYAWYSQLVKKIPADDSRVLKEHVDNLTEGASMGDKIKLIFQWVQSNISYVAFEDGMAGFVPRSSLDVFTKRYGDCKDMANLLKDMLQMAGIEAYHTWIGTRAKPYTYADVPSAIADDHMICSVKIGDEYVFLDATNSFLSFGKPSSMIQDKEALIGINENEFVVVKVPVVNKDENLRADSIKLHIEPNGVRGTVKSRFTGFKKDDLEVSQLRATIKNDKEAVQNFFGIGGNNVMIENLNIRGLGKQDENAQVTFDLFQPGYYKNVGDRIYINLHLNKQLPGEKIDIDRTQPLEADYHFSEMSVTTLEIPEGYELTYVPTGTNRTWEFFGFSVSYKTVGRSIMVEKKFYSDFLYLYSGTFSEYNDLLQTLSATNQQSVILTRKK